MRIVVYHTGYGCETGCCGHVIEVDDERVGGFDFGHPYAYEANSPEEREAKYREYAEDLVRDELGEEHVKDLDWEGCVISDD